jgi:hypothetical protein
MLAWPLWIWLGLHLSSLLGPLAAPVLIIVGIILCLGFVTELKVVKSKMQRQQTVRSFDLTDAPVEKLIQESSFWKVLSSSLHHLVTDSLADHEEPPGSSSEDDMSASFNGSVSLLSGVTSSPPLTELKLFGVDKEKQGTRYMLYLFWMFVLVEVLSHYYVLPFFLIPVVYRIARVFGQKRGAWLALADYALRLTNRCKGWVMSRKDIVAPAALRGLVRLAKQGDAKVHFFFNFFSRKKKNSILFHAQNPYES